MQTAYTRKLWILGERELLWWKQQGKEKMWQFWAMYFVEEVTFNDCLHEWCRYLSTGNFLDALKTFKFPFAGALWIGRMEIFYNQRVSKATWVLSHGGNHDCGDGRFRNLRRSNSQGLRSSFMVSVAISSCTQLQEQHAILRLILNCAPWDVKALTCLSSRHRPGQDFRGSWNL